jgi:MFS superfamily sulfate permease-like transporter
MKSQNWKKNWGKPDRFTIGVGILTLVIVLFFAFLLTIEAGVL